MLTPTSPRANLKSKQEFVYLPYKNRKFIEFMLFLTLNEHIIRNL